MQREGAQRLFLQQYDYSSGTWVARVPGVAKYGQGNTVLSVFGDRLAKGADWLNAADRNQNNAAQQDTDAECVQPQNAKLTATSCTCSAAALSRKTFAGFPGSEDSDSDADENSNKLTLNKLLSVFTRYQKAHHISAAAMRNLIRLASSVHIKDTDTVTDKQINQVFQFLITDQETILDCSLKLVEKLLSSSSWQRLVEKPELLNCVMDLSVNSSSQTQAFALQVLDKILGLPLSLPHSEFADLWEKLDKNLIPRIQFVLHGSAPEQVKLAACCVLRTVARDAQFAARIKTDSFFLVQQLRDCGSAELKEVYTGILMALFQHPGLTEAGSLDTGFLPVIKGLLKTGPCTSQVHALDLLACAMSDGRGVEAVVEDQAVVAFAVSCLLTSNCRKVRAKAAAITEIMISVQRKSTAQKVMQGINKSINPAQVMVGGGMVAQVSSNTQSRVHQDTRLWHSWDSFLDAVAEQLCKEALLDVNSAQLMTSIPMKGRISPVQLSCLTHLVGVAAAMCSFPVQRRGTVQSAKQRDEDCFGQLSDDLALCAKYFSLDAGHTVEQWNRFGPSILAILRWLTERIVNLHSEQVESRAPGRHRSVSETLKHTDAIQSRPPSVQRSVSEIARRTDDVDQTDSALSKEELDLLRSMLQFALSVSIVSCQTILNTKSSTDNTADRSSSSENSASGDKPQDRPTSALRSKAGVSKEPKPPTDKSTKGVPDKVEKQHADLKERLALADRMALRKGLYNEGLIPILGHLLVLQDPELKKLCCLILRTLVLPVAGARPVSAGRSDGKQSSSTGTAGVAPRPSRPQSSHAAVSTEKRLNIALSRMTPSTADTVKDALGPRSPSSASVRLDGRNSSSALSSRPPSAGPPSRPPSSFSLSSNSGKKSPAPLFRVKPLQPGQSVCRECRREVALHCGASLIQGLFSKSQEMKLTCLRFLLDVAKHADAEVLMLLSQSGIVPKLTDFLRAYGDQAQMAVTGLKVVKLLIQSDERLRQLFLRNGGFSLLSVMLQNPNKLISSEARTVFAVLRKVKEDRPANIPVGKRRPFSAPPTRQVTAAETTESRPKDVWDHIMQRWQEEDKVVRVLQKFLK